MRLSMVQVAAVAFLLVGCAPQGSESSNKAEYVRGAQDGLGQYAGYDAFKPRPTDPPEVVQALAIARADRDAAANAWRMGDRAAATQLSQKAMAELQAVQKK